MPAREIDEAFAAIALRQIDLKHMLQQCGQLVKCNASKNFARHSLFLPKTAPEYYVVTLNRIAALINLCSEQADIAHIVLGAGIRAAREMNVNR